MGVLGEKYFQPRVIIKWVNRIFKNTFQTCEKSEQLSSQTGGDGKSQGTSCAQVEKRTSTNRNRMEDKHIAMNEIMKMSNHMEWLNNCGPSVEPD